MNIVTFHKHVELHFNKSSGQSVFKGLPGNNYIFGRAQLVKLAGSQEFQASVLKQSLLEPRLANFVARQGEGGSVLVYNGCGGYGDQIMTWPLTLILHNMGYKVHVLVDPGNAECWSNFPWVSSVNILPMDLSVFNLFDHHLMFEVVSNLDEHHPQLHPLDSMLFKIGINPEKIDPAIKSVAPRFTVDEQLMTDKIVGNRSIGIYQLSAASRVRSLTPDESVSLLHHIAKSFPNITWYAVYDGIGHTHVFNDMLKEHPINVVPYISPNLRVLWSMIGRARVCVAPDSMVAHIAGSQSIPCVGLWGPVDPMTRVSYYRNHIAIFKRDACHMAPCHAYTTSFPKYCPTGQMPQCAVLSAISFNEVVEKIMCTLMPNNLKE
jgi:hypothetical protein